MSLEVLNLCQSRMVFLPNPLEYKLLNFIGKVIYEMCMFLTECKWYSMHTHGVPLHEQSWATFFKTLCIDTYNCGLRLHGKNNEATMILVYFLFSWPTICRKLFTRMRLSRL